MHFDNLTNTVVVDPPPATDLYWKGDVDDQWTSLNWTTDVDGMVPGGALPADGSAGIAFATTGAANLTNLLGADQNVKSLVVTAVADPETVLREERKRRAVEAKQAKEERRARAREAQAARRAAYEAEAKSTVVYAGRPRLGKASWISRIEHAPRVHSASMIFSSSRLSLVEATAISTYRRG